LKIDAIDEAILKKLLLNPRTSLSKIAKDCKMSTNAIRMRFKRLEKNGVITGSIMQINPKSLGYNCNGHLKLQTKGSKQDLFDFLSGIPSILGFHKQIGRYNVVAFFSLKDYIELDDLVQQINLCPIVLKTEVDVWVDVIHLDHPQNLKVRLDYDDQGQKKVTLNYDKNQEDVVSVIDSSNLLNKRIISSPPKLDGFDFSILKLLSNDARLSFTKIGAEIGLSTQRVIERFQKMEKKVFSFSSITVDLRKIGYNSMAFFQIMVSSSAIISTVFNKLLEVQNVIVAYRTLGNFQILVGIPCRDIDMLNETYEQIMKMLGVTEIELSLHAPFPSWPLNLFSKLIPS